MKGLEYIVVPLFGGQNIHLCLFHGELFLFFSIPTKMFEHEL